MSRYKKEIVKHLSALMQEGPIEENKNYIQHGDVTVFDHCIAVAEYSCRIAEFLHLSVNRKVLIRGALLHDYFLYDWHNPDNGHRLHGFSHPYTSLKNAKRDYSITKREADIIVKHMFPLTIVQLHIIICFFSVFFFVSLLLFPRRHIFYLLSRQSMPPLSVVVQSLMETYALR